MTKLFILPLIVMVLSGISPHLKSSAIRTKLVWSAESDILQIQTSAGYLSTEVFSPDEMKGEITESENPKHLFPINNPTDYSLIKYTVRTKLLPAYFDLPPPA